MCIFPLWEQYDSYRLLFLSLHFFHFFSLFSYYTAITWSWARDPVGPSGSFFSGIALESSVTRTEDTFELIHSNGRASKKWVTLTKTFRFSSTASLLLIPIHFFIVKVVIVWFCCLQPKNSDSYCHMNGRE